MQTKKINKNIIIKVILLGAILTIFALLAMYAWAKYMTSATGQTNHEIARWKFNVTANGVPITSQVIDFATSRDTNDTDSVARGTIAPGTYGVFELVVNTEGTETLAEYNIKIDLVDCPTNLRFYFDGEYTQELEKERINEVNAIGETTTTDELNLYRYIPLDKHGEFTERIYWQWPLETGNNSQDIYKSDLEDSKWLAKEKMTMTIAAVGTQVLEENVHFITYSDLYSETVYGMANIDGYWQKINNENIWTCSGLYSESIYQGPFFKNIHNVMSGNKRYRIAFEAKSNKTANIPIYYEADRNKGYNKKTLELTNEYQKYYLDIKYNGIGADGNNAIVFYTREWNAGDQLYIKNISISEIVTNGSTYGELYTPNKEGYIFQGWYTEENGGIQITANSRVNLTEDITLYAHWKKENE